MRLPEMLKREATMKPDEALAYRTILRVALWLLLLIAGVLLIFQIAFGIFPLGCAIVCAMLLVEAAVRYREDGTMR